MTISNETCVTILGICAILLASSFLPAACNKIPGPTESVFKEGQGYKYCQKLAESGRYRSAFGFGLSIVIFIVGVILNFISVIYNPPSAGGGAGADAANKNWQYVFYLAALICFGVGGYLLDRSSALSTLASDSAVALISTDNELADKECKGCSIDEKRYRHCIRSYSDWLDGRASSARRLTDSLKSLVEGSPSQNEGSDDEGSTPQPEESEDGGRNPQPKGSDDKGSSR